VSGGRTVAPAEVGFGFKILKLAGTSLTLMLADFKVEDFVSTV